MASFATLGQRPLRMNNDRRMARSEYRDVALVLSGGGARASYQVGVLSAIVERVPDLQVPIITGVSAGAINAVSLAAHPDSFGEAVIALREKWSRLTSDQVYCLRPTSMVRAVLRWAGCAIIHSEFGPGVLRGLLDLSPLRAFLAQGVDPHGVRNNIESGRLDALALSATSYASGKTVTFVEGCEGVPMWERAMRISARSSISLDHVLASSAIPIVFPAVKLEDGFYGDGSVRQTAPLAPAIHLGARRVIAIAMRADTPVKGPSVPIGDYPTAAEVVSLLFNSIFLDALSADVERLERLNQLVGSLSQVGASPNGLREIDLLVLKPSRDLGALAKGREVDLPWMVRSIVRSIGGRRQRASDLLSYLLFDPGYISELMDLGYSDAVARWSEIEQFIARCVECDPLPG